MHSKMFNILVSHKKWVGRNPLVQLRRMYFSATKSKAKTHQPLFNSPPKKIQNLKHTHRQSMDPHRNNDYMNLDHTKKMNQPEERNDKIWSKPQHNHWSELSHRSTLIWTNGHFLAPSPWPKMSNQPFTPTTFAKEHFCKMRHACCQLTFQYLLCLLLLSNPVCSVISPEAFGGTYDKMWSVKLWWVIAYFTLSTCQSHLNGWHSIA